MSDAGKANPTPNITTPSGFAVTSEQQQLATQMALRNPSIGRIYSNGFGLAFTQSDVSIVLNLSGNPVAILDMSFGTAKSMATDLLKLIDSYEKATGQSIKTLSEIKPQMEQMMAKKNAKPA